jgi:hypothetical protein
MKTLDWSVETLGGECNLTGLRAASEPCYTRLFLTHFKCLPGASTADVHPVSRCEEQIQKIADILERFDEESREKQLEEAKKDQWHFAAIILDRFFFILFGVTILICIISFYLQIPSSDQSAKGI